MRPSAAAATPSSITTRGPKRSIMRPSSGLNTAETRKPTEKAPAVVARGQPNSARMGGKSSENDVRAFTPIAIVTKAMATISQP